MKIRRLEIQGFKSFAERTVLKFGDGITGVVGPNGCGKSNIVDAIRWVMGEQSAKHLRGMGMQDVIFAGCEARGPAGMAEVSVVFKNDGALVPPEYQQHEEIQVTRRLFRDGTSEYAINKVGCRLRDILDLFMGTGVGKNAYAIIEQGRIGMIVTARPEERRALIEDAAGVSRYKARRKQAERRIAATEQNLVRITDIVTELGGRLTTLEAQAQKAERYKSIKSELRELELHAAAHRRLELDARELFETRAARALQMEAETSHERLETEEAHIQAQLAELSRRETELREREAAAFEHQQALELEKQNAEFLQREDGKLEERSDEATIERTELLAEKLRLEAERTEVVAVEVALGEGASEEGRLLAAREVALDALREQMAAARTELETEKTALVESLTAVAERKNAIVNLRRRGEDLENRALTAEHDLRSSNERAEATKKKIAQLERELSQGRQLKLALEEQQAEEERSLAAHREATSEIDATLAQHREKLLDRRSRLRSLQQIRANYEGCSDAVRAVMQREQDGLHGLVADVLTPDARYETAVEAVLGERLQSVVVAEQRDGHEAVRFLREAQKGRSTFVPMDLRLDHAPWAPRPLPGERTSTTPPADRPAEIGVPSFVPGLASQADTWRSTALPTPIDDSLPPDAGASTPETSTQENRDLPSLRPSPAYEVSSEPPAVGPRYAAFAEAADSWMEEEDRFWPDLNDAGVCGRMVDLVRTRPGYEHVAQALLGDVVVVESLDKAHELWVANGHRKTLVTLDGQVLDPMGIFTGGSSAGVSEGLLAQKREMEELRTDVAHLEARIAASEERKKDLRSKIVKLEARVKALSNEGQQGALSIVTFERDIASLRDRAHREREIAERAETEAQRLRAELASLTAEKEATEAALQELEGARQVAENRVSDAADALAEFERKARDLADEVTAMKVEVAANREKRDSSRQSLNRISARLTDIDTRLEKLSAVVEKAGSERTTVAEQVATTRTRIEDLERQVEAEQTTLRGEREALEGEKETIRAGEVEIRGKRTAVDNLRAHLSKCEMRVRELQIARENLEAQIFERYRIRLTEILTEFHVLAPQSDEHVRRTKKLRKQLADIGAINLTAIDEFREVKERHDHLARQKQDLEEAIGALKSAIRKINRTSRERYVEAFRLVNEKFQQVFPKVFAGGRCALVMTDEDDPLESGIEIMAQPPGKKLQSVNLLSGGEKALTAVSLIFGIFLIKPTPFCLLDEVDAPLDEANVGRYNDMLRDMAHISQFVLITHNKRTMELPERLYGVTMETPGISKIVPVDVVAEGRPKTDLRAV